MKIVFMGTPAFSVPSLERLIEEFSVEAVFTQPDRPKGRGKKLAASPVKEIALKHNIPVFQPVRLKQDIECINALRDIQPDFIIVVAFGQILPKDVLDIPKYGCINLHASLLPKFRGAAPINWAIISGEKKSGNTTMLMDVGLDTGDMLLKNEVEISKHMTYGELHDALMNSGAELLIKTIKGVVDGTIVPEKQDGDKSTYASMLNKELARIDWNHPARDINNLIRGLNPAPVAFTEYNGLTMKIYEADVMDTPANFAPGHIISVSKEGIKVAAEDSVLNIKKIQFPGGKPLRVEDYIRGNTIEEGIDLI